MIPPVHLTMASTLVSSIMEEVVMRWGEEEEELILITSDGHKLAASPSILALHSPLLSSMLSEGRNESWISVPGSAAQVSALLNFISRGETTFKNLAMLTEVKWLAAEMGIDLFNIKTHLCLGSETSSLDGEDVQDEGESYELRMEYENTNEKGHTNENEEVTPNENSLLEKICKNLDTVELRSKLQDIKNNKNRIDERKGETETLQCSLCPQTYKSKSKLKIHSLCHSNLKCDHCGKGFVFGTLLKRHIASVHSNSGQETTNHGEYSIRASNSYEYLSGNSISV